MRGWIEACAAIALLLSGRDFRVQQRAAETAAPGGATRQTETDEYTKYELLAPDSASFRIRYEVTATTAGATYYYNPIRKGSVATDEAIYDAMSGEALQFEIVNGATAQKDPFDGGCRRGRELHQGASRAACSEGRAGTADYSKDVQRCEELLPGRKYNRF